MKIPFFFGLLFLSFFLLVKTGSTRTQPQCEAIPTSEFERLLQRGIAERARLEAEALRQQEKLRKEEEARQRKVKRDEERRKREEDKKRQAEERKKREEAAAQERKKREEAKRQQQQRQQRRNPNPPKPKEKVECPYTVLGVARDATRAQIKKAFRQLSLTFHPDKNPDNETATEMFAKLVDAYEILGDDDRRAFHDDESFGAYTSRPRNFDSKAGFYSSTSLITPLNETEFDRLVLCQGPLQHDEECVPWMVNFYAPWCVHCKEMIPDWKRTAFTMDGTETPLGFVRFGAVNCEAEKALCTRQSLRAYPGIHLYAQDKFGQEHMEKFTSKKGRHVETLIEFCEKSIRLAHEASLQAINSTIMDEMVTNSNSTGLWIVLFEKANCPKCGIFKAQLRRMSANMGKLANFGTLNCSKSIRVCEEQYIGFKGYPELRLYPYKGSKGTGETLVKADEDPLVVLPIAERVIRMCIANIEAENALMKTLHDDAEEEEEEEPPCPEYEYPEPEVLPRVSGRRGVRAVGGGTQQKIGS